MASTDLVENDQIQPMKLVHQGRMVAQKRIRTAQKLINPASDPLESTIRVASTANISHQNTNITLT
jgi:hypothetical protein